MMSSRTDARAETPGVLSVPVEIFPRFLFTPREVAAFRCTCRRVRDIVPAKLFELVGENEWSSPAYTVGFTVIEEMVYIKSQYGITDGRDDYVFMVDLDDGWNTVRVCLLSQTHGLEFLVGRGRFYRRIDTNGAVDKMRLWYDVVRNGRANMIAMSKSSHRVLDVYDGNIADLFRFLNGINDEVELFRRMYKERFYMPL